MNDGRRHKLVQIGACLLCAAVVWRNESIIVPLEGTEFVGGHLTGPLLTLYDAGGILFVFAILLAPFFRRITAAVAVSASLVCGPLYLYFTAPGLVRWLAASPLRRIVGVGDKIERAGFFVWHGWAVAGIFSLAIAAFVALHELKESNNQGKKGAA